VGTVAGELTTTLADVRQVLRDDQNRAVPLAADLQDTLADVRQALRDDQNQVVHLAADFGKTAAAANGALERLEKVLTSFEGAVAPGAPLRYELAHTLEELSAAARAIRVLAQSLEQQPDAVIRGKVELRRMRGK
jgi:paraquat-inducible protein B